MPFAQRREGRKDNAVNIILEKHKSHHQTSGPILSSMLSQYTTGLGSRTPSSLG